MSAYLPTDGTMLFFVLGLLAAILAIGFAASRIDSVVVGRLVAWLLVICSVVGAERLTQHEAAGFRMVAIILALLFAMKSVVTVESRAARKPGMSRGVTSRRCFGARRSLHLPS